MDLKSFKLYLFAPKIAARDEATPIHNQVYDLWEDVWDRELKKLNSTLKVDHFLRQDFIPAVLYNNEVVSIHLYTLFNLDSHCVTKNPYFTGFKEESIDHFKKNKQTILMGMEYLTVNPKWRKTLTGIPFGEIMISIATKIMSTLPIDACIGTARTDINVDKMVGKLGGYTIETDINRSNLSTSLVSIPKLSAKPHPNIEIADFIDQLWNQKTDKTNYINRATQYKKVA